MEIDYEFGKQLILLSLSLGTSYFIARFVTSAWQVHRDKINMKEKVLDAFEKAVEIPFAIQYNFAFKLTETYTEIQKTDAFISTGKLTFKKKDFPAEKSELPTERFKQEYQEVKAAIEKSRLDGSHFMTVLSFYYEDEKIEADYRKLKRQLHECEKTLNSMFNSLDADPFLAASVEYQTKTDAARELVEEIERELRSRKLKEIPA